MTQLSFALEQITDKFPSKPYCSDDLSYGVHIRPKHIALLKRYIQPNHPYYTHFFVFDLDYPTAYIDFFYSMVGVPAPNLIVENPENGHAHYIYQLKTPIYNTDASKPKPIEYGNAVYNALRDVLNADVGYVGLMAKNPLNKQWRAYTLRDKPYSLNELASKLEIDWKEANKPIKQDEAIGLGRNCCVFHTVRKWAYVEIRKFRGKAYNQWLDAVVAECSKVNNQFTLPMNHNEMKGIAKSIARWVWKRDPHCYAMFIDRQTRKGALGASKGGTVRSMLYQDKRKQAQQLKTKGMSNTAIANELGVHRNSINTWLK